MIKKCEISENIIGGPIIQNNYGDIQLFVSVMLSVKLSFLISLL